MALIEEAKESPTDVIRHHVNEMRLDAASYRRQAAELERTVERSRQDAESLRHRADACEAAADQMERVQP